MSIINNNIYKYNSQGFWIRAEYEGISYSDGDETENKIKTIIDEAHDISVLSSELRSHCLDWPTTYHLSSQRANVLRPVAHILHGDILEIGAGCGAITRFLGEQQNCHILALEGSPRRASIAASRTRNLENVQVLSERFDDFTTDIKFDVITLIGVLEYSSMFSNNENPDHAMLNKIRSLLKPDGKLIIAIENKLGLKYFSGVPEDHVNLSMYGIENRYVDGGPKTYGKQELISLLQSEKFDHSTFLYPFPDYKLPKSILTDKGLCNKKFDASAFAWQTVHSDLQLTSDTTFALNRVWPEIFKNGLAGDLANSFIVVTSVQSDEYSILSTECAYHYSTERQISYSKETIFLENSSGDIDIKYQYLSDEDLFSDNKKTSNDFIFIKQKSGKYHEGKVLSQLFLELLDQPGWSFDKLHLLLDKYITIINSLVEQEYGKSIELKNADDQLPGYFIDALPQNIIISGDNAVFFDKEWDTKSTIEFGYLIFRALNYIFCNIKLIRPCDAEIENKFSTLIYHVFDMLQLNISDEMLQKYLLKEHQLQTIVTGLAFEEFNEDTLNRTFYTSKDLPISPKSIVSTLYFIKENQVEYNEKQSINYIYVDDECEINLSLSDISGQLNEFRLDPCQTSDQIRITSFDLIDAENKIVYDLKNIGMNVLSSVNMDVQILADHIICTSTSNDPQLYVSIPRDIKIEQVRVQMNIVRQGRSSIEYKQQISELHQILQKQSNQIQDIFLILTTQRQQAVKMHKQHDTIINQINNHDLSIEQQVMSQAQLIDSLQAELVDQKHELQYLNILAQHKALSDSLSSELEQVYSSTSWRMTKPFRWLGHQYYRMCYILPLIPKAIRLGGGVTPTIQKICGLYHRQGIVGLKNGLLFVNRNPQKFPQISVEDRTDYGRWVSDFDVMTDDKRHNMQTILQDLPIKPLISIVMPTYNSNLNYLTQAIESIQQQIYTNWELCIADDASPDKDVRRLIKQFAKQDQRIKYVFRKQNGHISASSNSALEIATGEWIALFDHDDMLPEHALFHVVKAINENPSANLIYSDEDKINESNQRRDPYFKPDWNPELFHSHNMICHFGVYRKSVLNEIGGFRTGYEGSQDYDLALRCIDIIDAASIVHIPHILYHWRIHAGSTASSGDQKPYAVIAGERALTDYLERHQIRASVESVIGGYRIHYALPEEQPLVSLIIPTRNGYAITKQCIDSIQQKTTYQNYEIILIDNGSDDPQALAYFEELRKQKNIQVIRDERPFNYSALNNAAVQQAAGSIVGLVNNDIEVISPDWLSEMVSLALQPRVGAVGAKLLYPNQTLQHAGVVLGVGGIAGHSHKYFSADTYGYFSRASLISNFTAVTAACLIVQKKIFNEVNGLNEKDLTIAFNDVDFCLKVYSAGYRNVWTPYAELYHHESISRGLEDNPEKQLRFSKEINYMKNTWTHILQKDPAYNPNLTLVHEDFSLAWPPRV